MRISTIWPQGKARDYRLWSKGCARRRYGGKPGGALNRWATVGACGRGAGGAGLAALSLAVLSLAVLSLAVLSLAVLSLAALSLAVLSLAVLASPR